MRVMLIAKHVNANYSLWDREMTTKQVHRSSGPTVSWTLGRTPLMIWAPHEPLWQGSRDDPGVWVSKSVQTLCPSIFKMFGYLLFPGYSYQRKGLWDSFLCILVVYCRVLLGIWPPLQFHVWNLAQVQKLAVGSWFFILGNQLDFPSHPSLTFFCW